MQISFPSGAEGGVAVVDDYAGEGRELTGRTNGNGVQGGEGDAHPKRAN
jgi:hypothetical protein